jgi:hypothetical protein
VTLHADEREAAKKRFPGAPPWVAYNLSRICSDVRPLPSPSLVEAAGVSFVVCPSPQRKPPQPPRAPRAPPQRPARDRRADARAHRGRLRRS